MTNVAGVEYLRGLGYPTARRFRLLKPEQVPSIDLDELYSEALAGATIYVNYRDIKPEHGPNGNRPLKMKTSHGIIRERFFEKFEEIRHGCMLPLDDQIFGICQTIPLDSLMSGICVKDECAGMGRLTAEATFGMRAGDFKPHLAIEDEICGGRRLAHNRLLTIVPPEDVPAEPRHLYAHSDWALDRMLSVMHTVFKDFGSGLTGIEFMYDFKRKNMYFVDFYRSTSLSQHVSRAR